MKPVQLSETDLMIKPNPFEWHIRDVKTKKIQVQYGRQRPNSADKSPKRVRFWEK